LAKKERSDDWFSHFKNFPIFLDQVIVFLSVVHSLIQYRRVTKTQKIHPISWEIHPYNGSDVAVKEDLIHFRESLKKAA